MSSTIANVYVSGWEYNRLLQPDLLAPRISALPIASLWRGAHQFWMFEHVICTRESVENELAAADALNWTSGHIVRDLLAEGILKQVDWSRDLNSDVQDQMIAKHQMLRSRIPGASVRAMVANRDVGQLELLKGELLAPMLNSLGAMASGAPNSLAQWQPEHPASPKASRTSIDIAPLLEALAAPTVPGLSVCRAPGSGLPERVTRAQAQVQERYETPLITELMCGDGVFGGPEGFLPYFEALVPHAAAYEPINLQLRRDWEANRADLLRLRQVAQDLLWEPLHSEWLPQLMSGHLKIKDFEHVIRWAFRHRRLLDFMNAKASRVLVGALPLAGAVSAAGSLLASHAGAGPTEAALIGGMTGSAAAAGVNEILESSSLPTTIRLGVFYQAAKKLQLGE